MLTINEPTVELLREVAKNAQMGKSTLLQLISTTEDVPLKHELAREVSRYEDLLRRTNAMLVTGGVSTQRVNALAKMGASLSIGVKTLRDKSAHNVAEMLIAGNHTGITSLQTAVRNYSGASEGAMALANRLQHVEEAYAEVLVSYL